MPIKQLPLFRDSHTAAFPNTQDASSTIGASVGKGHSPSPVLAMVNPGQTLALGHGQLSGFSGGLLSKLQGTGRSVSPLVSQHPSSSQRDASPSKRLVGSKTQLGMSKLASAPNLQAMDSSNDPHAANAVAPVATSQIIHNRTPRKMVHSAGVYLPAGTADLTVTGCAGVAGLPPIGKGHHHAQHLVHVQLPNRAKSTEP
eukprot:jgi/Chrzof1/8959/Cz03g31010.t1